MRALRVTRTVRLYTRRGGPESNLLGITEFVVPQGEEVLLGDVNTEIKILLWGNRNVTVIPACEPGENGELKLYLLLEDLLPTRLVP